MYEKDKQNIIEQIQANIKMGQMTKIAKDKLDTMFTQVMEIDPDEDSPNSSEMVELRRRILSAIKYMRDSLDQLNLAATNMSIVYQEILDFI